MSHVCHAPDCKRQVPAKQFCCPVHWFALPKKIQDAIWREYTPGQETTKRPTWRYMSVQRLALAYLVFEPHSEAAVLKSLPYLSEAARYSKKAIEDGQGDPLEGLIPKEWPTKMPVKARTKAKTL